MFPHTHTDAHQNRVEQIRVRLNNTKAKKPANHQHIRMIVLASANHNSFDLAAHSIKSIKAIFVASSAASAVQVLNAAKKYIHTAMLANTSTFTPIALINRVIETATTKPTIVTVVANKHSAWIARRCKVVLPFLLFASLIFLLPAAWQILNSHRIISSHSSALICHFAIYLLQRRRVRPQRRPNTWRSWPIAQRVYTSRSTRLATYMFAAKWSGV